MLLWQAYVDAVARVKQRLVEDAPVAVSLQVDAWTAFHTGYMGAIVGGFPFPFSWSLFLILCFLLLFPHLLFLILYS